MEHGNFSVLSYSAQSELDYGSVLCWAENELGKQDRPCVFHLMPAGNTDNTTKQIANNQKQIITSPSDRSYIADLFALFT